MLVRSSPSGPGYVFIFLLPSYDVERRVSKQVCLKTKGRKRQQDCIYGGVGACVPRGRGFRAVNR